MSIFHSAMSVGENIKPIGRNGIDLPIKAFFKKPDHGVDHGQSISYDQNRFILFDMLNGFFEPWISEIARAGVKIGILNTGVTRNMVSGGQDTFINEE